MEMEKSKVSIQFLLTFRQSGDVLFFLYARRLRGYTATLMDEFTRSSHDIQPGYCHCQDQELIWKHPTACNLTFLSY